MKYEKIIQPTIIITFLISLGAFLFQDSNVYIWLLNNFQLTFFFAILLMSFLILSRCKMFSTVLIITAIILMSSFIPYFYEHRVWAWENKMFYMNAYVKNSDSNIAKIVSTIKEDKYDYVSMVETNSKMIESLTEIYWPPKILKSEDCSFWTKNDVKDAKIKTAWWFTYCIVKLKDDTDVFIVHPFAGYTNDLIYRQKTFYEALNSDINSSSRFIVVWDFNNTIFNNNFRKYFWPYIKKSFTTWQYQNYERSFFLWIITATLRIPIDFAFSNIETFSISQKWFTFSDHEPIIVTF